MIVSNLAQILPLTSRPLFEKEDSFDDLVSPVLLWISYLQLMILIALDVVDVSLSVGLVDLLRTEVVH